MDNEQLYIQEILAWRGWNVDELFYLCSSNEKEPWGLYKTTAKCRNEPTHNAPEKDCGYSGKGCGLYGVFSPHEIPSIHSGRTDFIIGLAAFWGRTLIGEQGLRAQYARPFCIIEADHSHENADKYMRIARECASVYNIPILDIEEADIQFKQHLPSNFVEKKEREDQKKEAEKKLGTGQQNSDLIKQLIKEGNLIKHLIKEGKLPNTQKYLQNKPTDPPSWLDPNNQIDI